MELHELIEASESVSEGCIFYSLLVSYNKVVQSQERLDAVDQEVPVTGDAANWVAEQRQVHDLRESHQSLDVTPVADVVVVQVEELQLSHALEDLGRWETRDGVIT